MAEINSRSVSKAYISMAESEQFPCSEGKENIDIACSTHFEAVCLNVQMPGKVCSFVDTVHVSRVESEQFRRAEGNENIDIACSTHFEAVCLKVQMPGNVYSSIDIVSQVMSKVLRICGKHLQCTPIICPRDQFTHFMLRNWWRHLLWYEGHCSSQGL